MNNLLGALACSVMLLSTSVAATPVGVATVPDVGSNRYKSVRLTPEIYRGADPHLGDLRLFDADDEPVPYFLRSGDSVQQSKAESYPLALQDSYIKDNTSFVIFGTETSPSTDIFATSLAVATNSKSFAKEVSISGSHDAQHWTELGTDLLYRVDGREKMELSLLGQQRFTHYRLGLPHTQDEVVLTGATLHYNAESSQSYSFVESLAANMEIETRDRQTIVTVSGVENLRLGALRLHTDEMFKRMVSTPLGSRELYRLDFDGTTYQDTSLALNGRIWQDDAFVVTIENGDDKPLQAIDLELEYLADELVFEGSRGPYRLEFGTGMPAPSYDIASYRNQVITQPIDQLTIASVVAPATPAPPDSTTDWQVVFNIVLAAVAVLLGVLLLVRVRKVDK